MFEIQLLHVGICAWEGLEIISCGSFGTEGSQELHMARQKKKKHHPHKGK
jgi:hypothetical protein